MVAVAGAAVGGDDGSKGLENWGDELLDLCGWGLTEIQKTSRDFRRFIEARKEKAFEKQRHQAEIEKIQKERRKLKLKREEDGEGKRKS